MLSTVLPLFLVILLGYAAIRSGYVRADQIGPIAGFVVRIALPALIFNAVTSVSPGDALNWPFIAGYAGASLLTLALGLAAGMLLFGLRVGPSAMMGLGMAGSNSGFMGYPLALSVMGVAAAPMLAQCMLIENLLIIPLAMTIAEVAGGRAGGSAMRRVLVSTVNNPVLPAVLVALAISALRIPVPAPVEQAIDMLSAVAAPVALFVVGGTIATTPFRGMLGQVSAVALGKLVVHPVLVLGALSLAPGVDRLTMAGGLLFAAVPMMTIYPILGQRAGIGMMAASALVGATVASFATLLVAVHLATGILGG